MDMVQFLRRKSEGLKQGMKESDSKSAASGEKSSG